MRYDRDFILTRIALRLRQPAVRIARLHALDLEVDVGKFFAADIGAVIATRMLLAPARGREAPFAQFGRELPLSVLSFIA